MNQAELWQLVALLRQYVDEEAPAEVRPDYEQLRNIVIYKLHILTKLDEALAAAAPEYEQATRPNVVLDEVQP